MEKKELLHEGKAKKVYATDDPEVLLVDYKDDATAFNGLKKGTIAGKGAINNRVTNFMMQLLEKEGVPTHFVKELSDRELISVKYRDDKEICLSPLPKGRLLFENKTENERKEKEIRNALFKKAFIGGVSGGITGSVIYALISLIIKGA